MKRNNLKRVTIMFILLIASSGFLLIKDKKVCGQDPFFTLCALSTNNDLSNAYLDLIKQYLAEIGINLDIIILDCGNLTEEILEFHPFDLIILPFNDFSMETFLSAIYTENGTWNVCGYNTGIDWDQELELGRNEWMIQEINSKFPPNSIERYEQCWEWQYYLLDEILPCYPLFTYEDYMLFWDELKGFSYQDGLLQSWGKLSWDATHPGQVNTNEIVLADRAWTNLNPTNFSQYQDSPDRFITNFILEPLIWRDSDYSYWPHLVTKWEHISENQVRLTLRDGIKWQNDTEETFTDEILNADDIYFTFYVNEMIGNLVWIEDFNKVNSTTIDFTLKNDVNYQKRKIYGNYLDELANLFILPEYLLNQSQLIDGITPDTTHSSWDIFSKNPIGTGLMSFTSFEEGVETILSVNPDYWLLNQSINKNDMNFVNRFGNFTNDINQLRIRIIPNSDISYYEFENGRIDLHKPEQKTSYNYPPLSTELPSSISCSSKPSSETLMLVFNLREDRDIIGDNRPTDLNPEYSKGRAIRKAISYAIDRTEINEILHNGQLDNNNYPISPHFGKWCNPEIPYYCQNLDWAWGFMYMWGVLGYSPGSDPVGFPDWRYGCCDPCDIPISTVSINSYYLFNIFSILIVLFVFKRNKRSGEK